MNKIWTNVAKQLIAWEPVIYKIIFVAPKYLKGVRGIAFPWGTVLKLRGHWDFSLT